MKLYVESLGCARNQVDSEIMLGRLSRAGWTITHDPAEAQTIIVNTCSFIEDAADESIEIILDLAQYKKSGSCHRLIVTGCLPERYREDIATELPEVDTFLGTGAFDQIITAVAAPQSSGECLLPDPDLAFIQSPDAPRSLSTPHMAYLKIAEGCNRHCTYCIIPKLRGIQKSRPMDDIVAEACHLTRTGTKELILVAQDTTYYGRDLQTPATLSQLLKKLVDTTAKENEGTTWLRVLYGHPESIEDAFIATVASHPAICSYFDLPIQHASASVLKKMGRHYTENDLYGLFERIRSLVPEAVLRTTLIVGFPGETDTDFDLLERFVEDIRFDHLGVFTYSDADDLPSHDLPGHIPAAVAQERYDRLMSSQMDISSQNTRKYIDRTLPVLVEESLENDLFVGRTRFQAPEVDGVAYIKPGSSQQDLKIGRFVDIRVTDALEYDLIGETI
jgi:ribosomal protein S12 methylthiotransferase